MAKRKQKNFFLSGRKANTPLEILTILLILVSFAILGLFGTQVFSELNDDIQANEDLANITKDTSGDLESIFPAWVDGAFLLIFVLLIMFVLVAVFMVDTHPIFFVISIILLIGVFIAAMMLANAYNDIASDSTVSAFANEMPFMAFIMKHLVESLVGIGFMMAIVLYVKFR